MGKNNNGDNNDRNGSTLSGMQWAAGVVLLVIALITPLFTWITSLGNKVDHLETILSDHRHEQNRDDVNNARRDGSVDEWIKNSAYSLTKAELSLQKQITDGIVLSDAKLAALDVRLQAEIKVKDDNLQRQFTDTATALEYIRQKKISDERELSELQQQVRALERETFKTPLAPLSRP